LKIESVVFDFQGAPAFQRHTLTGLLHQLLGIRSEQDLLSHPKCGVSWEGQPVFFRVIRAEVVAPEKGDFCSTGLTLCDLAHW
jgi:hypothetical protein